jgi:hypothetical protein
MGEESHEIRSSCNCLELRRELERVKVSAAVVGARIREARDVSPSARKDVIAA